MMSHRTLLAAILALAATIVLAPAAHSLPTVKVYPKPVYVCEQGGDCMRKPSQLSFSANNDLIASKLKWVGWGAASTTAKGVVRVNWGGNPKLHSGRVKLYDLRKCGGAKVYRKGRVTWPGESVVVSFDCVSDYGPTTLRSFHSPSGNIGCYLSWERGSGSGVRCDVRNPAYSTPHVPDCVDLEQGDSLWLGRTVSSVCHGDTALGSGPVLAYGSGMRLGDHQCSMARNGVTCRNLVSGHGLRMSKASYATW